MFSLQPYKWTRVQTRSSAEPSPVSGHKIVYIDGNIYLYGGYNNDETHRRDSHFPNFPYLWQYNLASNTWKQIALCSSATSKCRRTASFIAAAFKFRGHDSILMFGGTRHPFGTELSSDLTLLDAEDGYCWQDGAPLSEEDHDGLLYPQSLYGQASLYDPASKAFYVVGGTQGLAYYMNVHRLKMDPGEWEALYVRPPDFEQTDAPTPRYRSELAFFNNKIYLLGGVYWDKIFGYQEVYTFDVKEKTWTNNQCKPHTSTLGDSTYPPEVKFHSILQAHTSFSFLPQMLTKNAFLIGGTSATTVNRHVWRLDLTDFSWALLPHAQRIPTYFGSCVVTPEGRAFSYGGIADVKTSERVNQLTTVWLTIPSLREMAWAALTSYHQKLNELPKEKLLELGIPLDLAGRIR